MLNTYVMICIKPISGMRRASCLRGLATRASGRVLLERLELYKADSCFSSILVFQSEYENYNCKELADGDLTTREKHLSLCGRLVEMWALREWALEDMVVP